MIEKRYKINRLFDQGNAATKKELAHDHVDECGQARFGICHAGRCARLPAPASAGPIISGFRFDGRPLNDEFRSALRDLLQNRGLVIFEPGTVTAENFTAFAGFLGEFFHYAGPHTPRAPEIPDATMIDSLKDKNSSQSHLACGRRVSSGRAGFHGAVCASAT